MKRMLLQVTARLLTCFLVWSDDTNVGQNEPSTCRYSPTCYPVWCKAVLSERKCSNRSQCCADVYNKVECLRDMFYERSKTLKNLSSELVDNLIKNISVSDSKLDWLRKEVDILNTVCDDNYKATSSEIQSLKIVKNSVNSKLESLEKISSDVIEKCRLVGDEIKSFKQRSSMTEDALQKLNIEKQATSDHLESLNATIAEHKDKIQTQISEVTDMFDKNISKYETKWQDLFGKETQITNQRFNSFDLRLTEVLNSLNSSVEMLNDTLENVKAKSTQDLQEKSKEMEEYIKTVESQTQKLEESFETYKGRIGADIEQKTNYAFTRSTETINKKSDELYSKITELAESMDHKSSDINTILKQLTDNLKIHKDDLESKIKVKTDNLRYDIDHKTEELDTRLTELSTVTKTDTENTNKSILELRKDIEEYKHESTLVLTNEKIFLTDLIQEKVSEVQTKIDVSLQQVQNDIEELKKQIGKRIKHEVDQLLEQTIAVNQTLNEQKQKVDIILPNTFNKEMFIIAFLVLVVLLAINYGIVYVLVKRTSPSQSQVSRKTTDNVSSAASFGEEPHSPVEVYNRLAFAKSLPNEFSTPLKDSIGVISFYEDSQKHHKRLMKSVGEHLPERLLHDVKVEYHVVRRHENIPGIPQSKLCIMFVEFSFERHVIIEEPGIGLGDLKRRTADFISKMGACLVIVYVKDPGSRHLKGSELFNSAIHCAKSQPELVALSEHKRFLSIYDKFNSNQAERLVDIITANLGHTGSGNRPNLRLNLQSLN